MNAIDAHHHLWSYNEAEYGWLGDEMAMLKRDFTIDDLRAELQRAGIDGSIAVQARQTAAETEWLLSLADEGGPIAGVVGWAPLSDRRVDSYLEKWSSNPAFVGVRHIIQDEPDPDFILGADFNRGVRSLNRYGLAYDILVFEHQLPNTLRFVDRHPHQRFILDHAGKPSIRDESYDRWAAHIADLAAREHIYCKLSGLVTEANWKQWSEQQIARYVDHLLETFGPRRLMFGSDWPVCLVAATYAGWVATVVALLSRLSDDERSRIFGGTAREAYRLKET